MAGELGDAGHAARCAEVLPLPDALRRGVDMELAEQALASGDAALARERFAFVLARHGEQLDANLRAVVLQRRATAAAANDERAAAEDFCAAAELMQTAGLAADAEAARLAAASCLSAVDPAGAETLWRDIDKQPPRDGAGALDARDAASYLAASVQSASLLEQQGQAGDAYARLASAWVTLGDLLGCDPAAALVRPAMQGLRERMGTEAFQRVREGYAARRRRRV